MAKDATAGAPAQGVSEENYQSLLTTLSASALGRGFLAEFARRNRAADTDTLLAAIGRLEAMIAARSAEPAAPAEPATADALVKPQVIESSGEPVAADAANSPRAVEAPDEVAPVEAPFGAAGVPEVTWVVDVAVTADPPAAPPAEVAPAPAAEAPAVAQPAPSCDPPVAAAVAISAAAMEQVSAAQEPPTAASPRYFAEPPGMPRDWSEASMPPRDPLDQIMALSEEERIALFS